MSKYTTEQLQEMARHVLSLPIFDIDRAYVVAGLSHKLNLPENQVMMHLDDLANGRTVH